MADNGPKLAPIRASGHWPGWCLDWALELLKWIAARLGLIGGCLHWE